MAVHQVPCAGGVVFELVHGAEYIARSLGVKGAGARWVNELVLQSHIPLIEKIPKAKSTASKPVEIQR